MQSSPFRMLVKAGQSPATTIWAPLAVSDAGMRPLVPNWRNPYENHAPRCKSDSADQVARSVPDELLPGAGRRRAHTGRQHDVVAGRRRRGPGEAARQRPPARGFDARAWRPRRWGGRRSAALPRRRSLDWGTRRADSGRRQGPTPERAANRGQGLLRQGRLEARSIAQAGRSRRVAGGDRVSRTHPWTDRVSLYTRQGID